MNIDLIENILKNTKEVFTLKIENHQGIDNKMRVLYWMFITISICWFAFNLYGNEVLADRGGIEFSFANVQIITLSSIDYLSFDIQALGSGTAARIGTGIILFNYSSTAFGNNICANNNVIVSKGILTSPNEPTIYNIIINDNQSNRLAITFEYTSTTGTGNRLQVYPKTLVNVKLKIIHEGNYAGLSFASTLMMGQQYQDDNITLLSPITTTTIDNSYLPSKPIDLLFSIHNGALQLSWQEVPGCTYSIYSASSPISENWQVEATGLIHPNWSTSLNELKRFYYVTSKFSSERRQK
jgi:hypothetical protein